MTLSWDLDSKQNKQTKQKDNNDNKKRKYIQKGSPNIPMIWHIPQQSRNSTQK